MKRTAIKEGTVAVGEKVKVTWGKAKKCYNAEILSVGSTPTAPVAPRGRPATAEEPFTFEMAAAAPCASTQRQATPRADPLELEGLADAVSGVEARLLCRLQALEEKMTTLQREILEKCALPPPSLLTLPAPIPLPPTPSATQPAPGPAALPPPPSASSTPGPRPAEHVRSNGEQETPATTPLESPAPRDVSSSDNVASSTQEGYIVPGIVVSTAMFGCKSRRNLAARLADKVFTPQERQGSNCRGVLGKTPLDVYRVKAIYSVCMQHFPLQRLETQLMADKEMRTAIDETCKKTKDISLMDKENYGIGSLV